jgi:hypothetical protein
MSDTESLGDPQVLQQGFVNYVKMPSLLRLKDDFSLIDFFNTVNSKIT